MTHWDGSRVTVCYGRWPTYLDDVPIFTCFKMVIFAMRNCPRFKVFRFEGRLFHTWNYQQCVITSGWRPAQTTPVRLIPENLVHLNHLVAVNYPDLATIIHIYIYILVITCYNCYIYIYYIYWLTKFARCFSPWHLFNQTSINYHPFWSTFGPGHGFKAAVLRPMISLTIKVPWSRPIREPWHEMMVMFIGGINHGSLVNYHRPQQQSIQSIFSGNNVFLIASGINHFLTLFLAKMEV